MKTNHEKLQLLATIFQGIIALGILVIAFRGAGLTRVKLESLSYLLSSALQVGGAAILFMGTFGKSSDLLVNEVLQRLSLIKDTPSGREEPVSSPLGTSHVSRAAFGYLGIGYVLAIFGKKPEGSVWGTAFFSLAAAVVLVGLTYLFLNRRSGQGDKGGHSDPDIINLAGKSEEI